MIGGGAGAGGGGGAGAGAGAGAGRGRNGAGAGAGRYGAGATGTRTTGGLAGATATDAGDEERASDFEDGSFPLLTRAVDVAGVSVAESLTVEAKEEVGIDNPA